MIKVLPWTWSKLSAYETCAFRHLKCDLQKTYAEGDSDHMRWGNKVHKAFEAAIPKNLALPKEMAPWQRYVSRLHATPGEITVEQKYALTKDLQPCEYFAPAAWYRGKADVAKFMGSVAFAGDWKTGRRKKADHNNHQLMLMAQCILSHHPEVEQVLSRFVWLDSEEEEDQVWTRQKAADVWANNLLPRVERMLNAAETDTYLPKPGGLCMEYCPVQVCEFWKKGTR